MDVRPQKRSWSYEEPLESFSQEFQKGVSGKPAEREGLSQRQVSMLSADLVSMCPTLQAGFVICFEFGSFSFSLVLRVFIFIVLVRA